METSEAFVTLRKLTLTDTDPVEEIIGRGLEHLAGLKVKAIFELRLVDREAGTVAR